VTGAINPIDGRGTLVDTGLSPGYEIKNTPRYAWGAGQGAIVYNKTIDGIRTLAKAVEVAPNTWETSLLENGEDRWKANGSPEETTDGAHRLQPQTPQGTHRRVLARSGRSRERKSANAPHMAGASLERRSSPRGRVRHQSNLQHTVLDRKSGAGELRADGKLHAFIWLALGTSGTRSSHGPIQRDCDLPSGRRRADEDQPVRHSS
jgi:hypothetical protein